MRVAVPKISFENGNVDFIIFKDLMRATIELQGVYYCIHEARLANAFNPQIVAIGFSVKKLR